MRIIMSFHVASARARRTLLTERPPYGAKERLGGYEAPAGLEQLQAARYVGADRGRQSGVQASHPGRPEGEEESPETERCLTLGCGV